jgi:hypothetical protein
MSGPQPFTNAKLEDFLGDGSSDARTWIARYERYCTRAKFNDDMKLQEFHTGLKGNASLWFETEAESIDNYAALKAEFLKRFASEDEHHIPRVQQYEEETADDYYSRYLNKIRHCRLDDGYKVHLFVDGLKSDLKPLVFMSEPKTLNEARRTAIRAEQARSRQPTADVSAVYAQQDEKYDKLCKLLEQAMDMKLKQEAPREYDQQPTHYRQPNYHSYNYGQRQPETHYQPRQSFNQRRGNRQQSREECRHCDGKALNCSFSVNGKCPGISIICKGCNKKGHFAKACYRWSTQQ